MAATYDIGVRGGTAACFATATAADEGVDSAPLDRNAEEAGHIACGGAVEGNRTAPDAIDRGNLNEASVQIPCHG